MNWRVSKFGFVAVGVCLVASCSSTNAASNYSAETRDGFMAACTDSVSDSRLVADICGCVYNKVNSSVAFSSLEAELITVEVGEEQTVTSLSPSTEAIVAGCIAAEASLGG